MQAVERKRHIDLFFYGQGVSEIKEVLKRTYPTMEFFDNADDVENAWKEMPISTMGYLQNVEMPWHDS